MSSLARQTTTTHIGQTGYIGETSYTGLTGETNDTKPPQTKLVDIEVKDEVMALNLIVSFLNLAQRRGAFSLDESSKLWECIKMFQKPV